MEGLVEDLSEDCKESGRCVKVDERTGIPSMIAGSMSKG